MEARIVNTDVIGVKHFATIVIPMTTTPIIKIGKNTILEVSAS